MLVQPGLKSYRPRLCIQHEIRHVLVGRPSDHCDTAPKAVEVRSLLYAGDAVEAGKFPPGRSRAGNVVKLKSFAGANHGTKHQRRY